MLRQQRGGIFIFLGFVSAFSQNPNDGRVVIDSKLDLRYVPSIEQQISNGTFIPSTESDKPLTYRNDNKENYLNIKIRNYDESDLAKKLVKNGTDVLVAGNFIFKSDNPNENINSLKKI